MNGISRVNPLITGDISYLLSGMIHQVVGLEHCLSRLVDIHDSPIEFVTEALSRTSEKVVEIDVRRSSLCWP